MTGELAVVALAVTEIRGDPQQRRYASSRGFGLATLPTIHNDMSAFSVDPVFMDASTNQIKISNMIAKLIDPMFYVMTYSVMTAKELTILSTSTL